MKTKSLISGFLILFLFVSVVVVAQGNQPLTPKMPDNVKAIIDNSCFGCHNTDSSNDDAKEELDFKKLDTLTLMKKISAYKHIGEVIEENEMPPEKFLEKRPEKKLTDDEKKILMAWAKTEAEALVKSK